MILRSATRQSNAGSYDVFDVFTPTTQATLNFVERPGINDQLVDALRTPGKQIVVYGETGSGKSTLLQNKLAQLYESHIVTQCHAMMTFDQILLDAFDQLAPFYAETLERSKGKSMQASLSADFMNIQAGLDATRTQSSSESDRRVLPPQLTPQRLGEFMGERGLCWVIEDFHKVAADQKKLLAQSLKVFCDLARRYRDVKIITIGATDTAREVIEFDPEMSNRVAEILVPLMTDEEIDSIIQGGERLLNVDFGVTRKLIMAYSVGVGSICHQLALNCCIEGEVVGKLPKLIEITASDLQVALQKYIQDSSDTLKGRFENALMRKHVKKYDNCRLILKALANGPLDGMLFSELLTIIRTEHANYPAGNLTTYLRLLQHADRGALIRLSGSGRYCFMDPFHHLFAHLTLANEQTGRNLSEVNLLGELKKELAETVAKYLNQISNDARRGQRQTSQLSLWSDGVAARAQHLMPALFDR